MNILALDTASSVCAIGISSGGKQFVLQEDSKRMHNARILPMLKQLLITADLALKDIDAIAFGQGPGSFVGARVAASVVQGLAFAHETPVIPLSSLQVIAQSAYLKTKNKKIAIAVDGRVETVYFACYELQDGIMQAVVADCSLKPADIKLPTGAWFKVGNAWVEYADKFEFAVTNALQVEVSATALLQLAEHYYKQANFISAEQALPVYLHSNW